MAASNAPPINVDLTKALGVGRALATIKNLDELLEHILRIARELTGAEGASIYTLDSDENVVFRAWQNAITGGDVFFSRATVGQSSLAGYVVRNGETLNLDDVYTIPEDAPYRFDDSWDRKSGYRTQSVLTVPMTDKKGMALGALQLINCLRDDPVERLPVSFDGQRVAITECIAGQAGVALENNQLYLDIENLLDGMIFASIKAIEARDPTTAGHSVRVADYCLAIAQAVDNSTARAFKHFHFTEAKLKELRYAALLHDFGKLGVREHVLVKAEKLYPRQFDAIKMRFELAREATMRQAYQSLVSRAVAKGWDAATLKCEQVKVEKDVAEHLARLDTYFDIVLTAKKSSVLDQNVADELTTVYEYALELRDGTKMSLLDFYEFESLSVTKGSLRPDERREIESHVTHTYQFLNEIPWGKELKNVANIAHAHHEKLDGSGYPRQLCADEIPLQSQIMAVADIFDALSAWDRPYKKAVPEDKSLAILRMEADAGKVNADIVDLFCYLRKERKAPN